MIPWLRGQAPFPPIEAALQEPNGLLAAGGELTPERLLEAYSRGIFPWYSDGQPVLWWSPDPRTVLFVDEFKIPRSLRKVVAQRRFDIRVDTAFREVIQRCAEPRSRERRTWITPVMMDAYTALHAQGHAHSVEAWDEDGLVGGLYGVAVGRVFFGESMFARRGDASKVALVRLVAILRRLGVPFIDCQQETEHLSRFGARPIDRNEFAEHLSRLVHSTLPAHAWKDAAQAESSP
jgi:leucyl/phenylalanyl-tRNA--protein transferase